MSLPAPVAGALAGFAATAPMTAAMEAMHDRLPPHEQYPLPPHQITTEVAEKAGMEEQVDTPQHKAFTMLSHFGYGAAAGALYAPLAERRPLPPAVEGAAYGMAVWAGSYLGLLPALGILPPATEHPPRRVGLMITAHLVWGASLGILFDRLHGE